MAKGMEFPQAPAPREEAEALLTARERTSAALAKWKARNVKLYAAMTALAGLSTVEQADAKRGVDEAAQLWSPELRKLDPEMTRERFVAVMETVPDGFVEERIFAIAYKDERRVMSAEYGLAGLGTLATAVDAGSGESAPTLVTFYRDAHDASSRFVWGDVVLHEIAHANDWEGDPTLETDDRRALKSAIVARLGAQDRFGSSYVERIDHDDEKEEIDHKAKEYWAEIFSAWLRGEDLSEADAEIVETAVRRKDPDFDRDAAREKREAVLSDMEREESGAKATPAAPTLSGLADWEPADL